MTLLYPERLSEILQAWVNVYKEGGWLPQFPCPGYRNCMTGSPLDFVFGDAVVKGIPGFDVQAAYAGLKKHATQPVAPGLGYGRPAVAEYEKLGFIPCDVVLGGLAETLDSAYGDYCIAQVARAAGKPEAAMFEKRSRNWRNSLRSRYAASYAARCRWIVAVGPLTRTPGVVRMWKAWPWQYRFAARMRSQGLMEAMGGERDIRLRAR